MRGPTLLWPPDGNPPRKDATSSLCFDQLWQSFSKQTAPLLTLVCDLPCLTYSGTIRQAQQGVATEDSLQHSHSVRLPSVL
ncbi:hypothetical protein PM082_019318 [Marasmius tenuissimus]|nr:hypothetical protein PM082_019318 [Marasmius tenuissimus]